MSVKKLTHHLLSRYKSTDSLPAAHRYAAWCNGLKDPVVGPGDKKYSKSLFTELVRNRIPVTDIMVAETPICKRIQNTKKFCTENFPNLCKRQHYMDREWWLYTWLYKEWGTITRASDVFIKGLGSFDFAAIASKVDAPWDLRLSRIRGEGYFPGTHRHYQTCFFFNTVEMTQYLVKYWAVLKGHPHIDAVSQNLAERKDLKMPFMDIHPDRLELETGNVVFGWLADVEFPGFTIPKTGKELQDAAVRFQNCARHYIASVMKKRSLILWNNNGMAEYHPEYGLGQCSGVGNAAIDRTPFEAIQEDVKKVFKRK